MEGAVAAYRAALSLERGRFEVERSLALTLLALGRANEAETYLGDLLQRAPASGPLNRGMARIHSGRGDTALARTFYQRAVYGEWPPEEPEGRLNTRFELLEYLAGLGARDEMLAALLQLQGELPVQETAAIRRVASLFEKVGSVGPAIDLLARGAAAAPRDVELLSQLARLQRESGRSRDARDSLRRALAVSPDRDDLRERLAVVDRVLTLDPTLPELRLVARTRRARQLLAAVAAFVRACPAAAAPQHDDMMLEVDKRLATRAPVDAQAAEDELALAVQVWNTLPECRGTAPEARALAQVVRNVAAVGGPA
jgi:tetratricopeptide (TPR) repeat protein